MINCSLIACTNPFILYKIVPEVPKKKCLCQLRLDSISSLFLSVSNLPLLSTCHSLCSAFTMQLTYVLTAAFGILASARLQRPHGYSYNQQKGVAQVRDYVPNGNTGFNSSTGTGTGTVTNIGSPGSCPTIVAPPSNNGGGSTASFTRYSGCNSPSAACGWYSSTGYNAAISQAAFGGAPGSGPGTACGGCWRLAPGFSGANAIVVKVNNLCPADENNPVCAKPAG